MLISTLWTTHDEHDREVFHRNTYEVTGLRNLLAFWLTGSVQSFGDPRRRNLSLIDPPRWTWWIGVPGRWSWRLSLGHYLCRLGQWAYRFDNNNVERPGQRLLMRETVSTEEALALGMNFAALRLMREALNHDEDDRDVNPAG